MKIKDAGPYRMPPFESKPRWVAPIHPDMPAKLDDAISAAVESYLRLHTEIIDNALKSLIMFGWATDELVLCHWPAHMNKTTIRAGGPDGKDVFELKTISPWSEALPSKAGDEYHLTLQGRWVSWPYKY